MVASAPWFVATTEPLAAIGNAHTMIGAVSTGV